MDCPSPASPRGTNGWITSLETRAHRFWDNLSILSSCGLDFEMAAATFQTTVDLSSAHLTGDGLLFTPCSSLNLDTRKFDHVYATGGTQAGEDHHTLEMISRERTLRLSLSPVDRETLVLFNHFVGTYAQEVIPEASCRARGEPPHLPTLCPCCQEAGQARVGRLMDNPLTAILAGNSCQGIPLMVSLKSAAGSILAPHLPRELVQEGDWLISRSSENRVRINIRHLHALFLDTLTLEGIPHEHLSLLNSHGEQTCSFAAPSGEVAQTWRAILEREEHCYQVHHAF